jgi:hypothetical protein
MHIKDLYGFSGFRAQCRLKEHPFDQGARIIVLKRRQKKQFVPAAASRCAHFETGERISSVIWMPQKLAYTWNSSIGVSSVRGATL